MSFGSWVINMADPGGKDRLDKLDYWGLVGHFAVMFGLPVAIPILGAFFWLGQLSSRVGETEKQTGHLLEVIGGLVTLDAGQTEKLSSNGSEIDRLRNTVDAMIRQSFAPIGTPKGAPTP